MGWIEVLPTAARCQKCGGEAFFDKDHNVVLCLEPDCRHVGLMPIS